MAELNYNPDVLTCLANLSNDEVFTPPSVANAMLDLLPQELFSNPNTRFLDPACKSGVFLREIAKRLLVGLEDKIPDLNERVEHIFREQLYGIAITELTSMISRRSVYCSKYANCEYSIVRFPNPEGNIRYKLISHRWQDGKCVFCGAAQSQYDRGDELESHAYELIHTVNPEEIFNMKFDVVIGNPPYQLNMGNKSGNKSKASAIYHNFISKAILLSPRYLVMITPSRWMTRTTEGIPEAWVDKMLSENHFITMHDFLDASECFPGVEIKGGVNFFLWSKEYTGKCKYYLHLSDKKTVMSQYDYLDSKHAGIVIRDIQALSIIDKIICVDGFYIDDDTKNFSGLVSPKDFFTNKQLLTSSWDGYSDTMNATHSIKYYLNKSIHKKPYG
ncbi:MAG: Eco57I restriction-modification methylase domain-containing protein, partial [Oscillospiraceae bacterium]